ncbi:hypothetical protein IDSA_05525 [Pseudidiomarina salinarum]|uniref:Uncharacterized protein n=1 Tax=Pseudidiomarina salinarum TaxID=435908 RepID=A0A094IWR4_9GAMM|nr:hypothetical protein [Pseudidiomarina salinarum]KFZ32125.1 hypothetical protein IDSA_05525 [Pseudidiomarina salinarum]RUO70089.1 hypothetical protein CWI79_01070 [Pseudidiomarina salinarum]
MTKDVEIIFEKLQKKEKARSFDSIEYALFLTFDINDLCAQYFSYLNKTEIRNNFIKHILERIERRGERLPENFIEKLLREFYIAEGRRRISLGTSIKIFGSGLNKAQRLKFIKYQLLSPAVLDRKRAFSLIDAAAIKDVESMLWEAWKKYSDSHCLEVLSKYGSLSFLSNHFLQIWNAPNIKFRVKNDVLKRVAVDDFSKVEFLKKDAPVSFLSASIAANRSVDDEFALSVVHSVNKINELGYFFWCLGKLGKKELLLKLLDNIDSIENQIPIETWEPEFYRF